jgi:GR25 family glycosyltransferase involved in LPS biosynthesis
VDWKRRTSVRIGGLPDHVSGGIAKQFAPTRPTYRCSFVTPSFLSAREPMNEPTYSGILFRLVYRLVLGTGRVGAKRVCNSFSSTVDQRLDAIRRILVINLDRQTARWSRIQQELQKVFDSSTTPLARIARRFSAVDARDYIGSPSPEELQTRYSLADQLFVEPNPLLTDEIVRNESVTMTRQEVAVALSHIAVWKLIASGDQTYTLVLEDDVYFHRAFAPTVDKAWADLMDSYGPEDAFDLLYLSYKEAKTKAVKHVASDVLFRPRRGLWHLSGYVLSKKGATNLLGLLPVRGPVDLWINQQFDKLDVFATHQSMIRQRLDSRSDNLYSILPVLSRVGVLTRERPLLFKTRKLPNPVFAFGEQGTGLTSLAIALSMLGYRCCSDINTLPTTEHEDLFSNRITRVFDAYVNVGSLSGSRCLELAKLYPRAKFIITGGDGNHLMELNQDSSSTDLGPKRHHANDTIMMHMLARVLGQSQASVLVLPRENRNKWRSLCGFLECEHPGSEFPALEDQGQRSLSSSRAPADRSEFRVLQKLKHDSSPWIASKGRRWKGIRLAEASVDGRCEDTTTTLSEQFQTFDASAWVLRADTFPSNLALFRPSNFAIEKGNGARMTFRKETSSVRNYTSGSICSRRSYLYGRFTAVVRPANVPGLITGMFLHRNSPRQEIDIEFLGKDTTKLLVNVYYNPGGEGANLEYGYRGTPILVDLGFDASKDFHHYSIEWSSTSIRWLIDGHLAYERVNWDPTPIPHLPMQFYVNLWHSRSEELSGKLRDCDLPAHTDIRSVDICSPILTVNAPVCSVRAGN